MTMDVIICHNPGCGTPRNSLAMIRNAGIEPPAVEYLQTSPFRDLLRQFIERMGITLCAMLREKGTPNADLPLDGPARSDEALIDAMMEHPIPINRPSVVSPKAVSLCRPSEAVLNLLPAQRAAFGKADGEQVEDDHGNRTRCA